MYLREYVTKTEMQSILSQGCIAMLMTVELRRNAWLAVGIRSIPALCLQAPIPVKSHLCIVTLSAKLSGIDETSFFALSENFRKLNGTCLESSRKRSLEKRYPGLCVEVQHAMMTQNACDQVLFDKETLPRNNQSTKVVLYLH